MKTKSFISDDVIQRIASGNEPTQTLISLDVLKNVLKPHQMRNVLGGSGYLSCLCICHEDPEMMNPYIDFYAHCYGTYEECVSWYCPGIYCYSPKCD